MITLEEVKKYLGVIHSYDDQKLEIILAGAIDEALQYCNQASLESIAENGETPHSFKMGVILLCQGDYNVGVDDIATLRRAAETKLHPYRIGLGI